MPASARSSGRCAGPSEAAEVELARLLVEAGEGRHAAAAPMTFGELLDRWLAVKRLAVERTTLSSCEWVARTYVRPALGERKVASLRPIELDGLYAELSEPVADPATEAVDACRILSRRGDDESPHRVQVAADGIDLLDERDADPAGQPLHVAIRRELDRVEVRAGV